MLAGYEVVKPAGVRRYDLAIVKDRRIERVQVKHGTLRAGGVHFAAYSTRRIYNPEIGTLPRNVKYNYLTDAEFFGVYCSANDQCYLVPVRVVNNGSLRIDPTKNNQSKFIVWAKDFLIK